MKHNIKNYLTLAAALAGSAFLVSCDSGSSSSGSSTPTPTPTPTPAEDSITDTINSDASFNVLKTGLVNNLTITFDDDPSNTPILNLTGAFIGTFGGPGPGGSDIRVGQTFIFNPPYTATGVSVTPGVIMVDRISDGTGPATNDDLVDVVLTETSLVEVVSDLVSEGTFTGSFELPEIASVPSVSTGGFVSSPGTTIALNGAGSVVGFVLFPNAESTPGSQPVVTSTATPSSIFTVAVGDVLFEGPGPDFKLYITDASNVDLSLAVPASTPTHDIATAKDATGDEVFCLTQDGAPAVKVPQTGTYKMTVSP